jgi:hypothetical protein
MLTIITLNKRIYKQNLIPRNFFFLLISQSIKTVFWPGTFFLKQNKRNANNLLINLSERKKSTVRIRETQNVCVCVCI